MTTVDPRIVLAMIFTATGISCGGDTPKRVEDGRSVVIEKSGPNGSQATSGGERTPSDPAAAPVDVVEPIPHFVLTLTVQAEPRYLIGFPMVVALTYENQTKRASVAVPVSNLWYRQEGLIGARLTPVQLGSARRPSFWTDLPRERKNLPPGASIRMLYDLARLGGPWQPGVYDLSLHVLDHGETPPVRIELVQPSASDAAEASRLRRLGLGGDDDTGSWTKLLLRHNGAVTVSPALSTEASRQLALYVFYHQAVHGAQTPAQLDIRRLAAIAPPTLQAEVAALELEIAAARRDPWDPLESTCRHASLSIL